MNATTYLPANSASFFTVQPLMGDRRPVSLYEGDSQVPLCITREITKADCAKLLNSDGPVTFTCRVPLNKIVEGSDSMREHIEETAFAFPVSLRSCEYRPVGATVSDFSSTFAGDVLIQVTCEIVDAS